ncbi:MAG TPA: M23 family metallopeptidase [Vicinamibacterales bacterium]|jgi:murein DD-endopeptidase MepM/ murein hydrolase activator NlpD|nr:M23 family metallopeptidase [Vicinamibacterales bacterium]
MRTKRERRLAAAAATAGFLAGVFVISVSVWRFGNFIGTRTDRLRYGLERSPAVERFTQGVFPDLPPPPAAERTDSSPPLHPAEPPAATSGNRDDRTEAPTATIGANPVEELRDRRLLIPVDGVGRNALVRSYDDERGGSRKHEAIDILAPRNTPVLAVESGTVARLFNSRYGGLTVYQYDPDERFIYYYAHLERYADGLKEEDKIRRGQVIGYVGTSGNAPPNTPHLHFAIFRALEPPRWWEGVPLDPYNVLR